MKEFIIMQQTHLLPVLRDFPVSFALFLQCGSSIYKTDHQTKLLCFAVSIDKLIINKEIVLTKLLIKR